MSSALCQQQITWSTPGWLSWSRQARAPAASPTWVQQPLAAFLLLPFRPSLSVAISQTLTRNLKYYTFVLSFFSAPTVSFSLPLLTAPDRVTSHAVRPLLLQHSHCRPSTWNTFWILLFRNLSLSPYLISKPCRSLRGGSYPLSVKVMAFKTKALDWEIGQHPLEDTCQVPFIIRGKCSSFLDAARDPAIFKRHQNQTVNFPCLKAQVWNPGHRFAEDGRPGTRYFSSSSLISKMW